jgi:hypothetical protein
MIEIISPLGKYKYDTWRILSVKCNIDNSMRLRSCIRSINSSPKLSKALYGLKQALQAWYARLKTFLLEHGYVIRSVDKTLFALDLGNEFLLVQIYVDDIIFGGSSHVLVSWF